MDKKEIVTAVKFASYATSMLAIGCLGGHFAPKSNKLLKTAYVLGVSFLGTPVVLSASEYWGKIASQLSDTYFTSDENKPNEEEH